MLVIDCLTWQVIILPDGRYSVMGPIWPQWEGEPEELTNGRLGYGFALPGIERAVAEIIKAAVNKKS